MKKRLLCLLLMVTLLAGLMPAAYAEGNVVSYTVKSGDTLVSICGSYGMNYYNVKSAIMKLNGFTSEKQLDTLSPGQVIKLPASEDDAKNVTASSSASAGSSTGGSTSGGSTDSGGSVSYVVKAGDTFVTICEEHGLNFFAIKNQLMKLNGFKNASQLDSLRVGQTVKLPGSGSTSSTPGTPETPDKPSTPSTDGGTTTPAPSVDYKTISHTVGEWDTLLKVCGSYGMNFYTVKYAIMKLNGFTSERQLDILSNGQVIKLPASEDDAKLVMSASTTTTKPSGGSTDGASTGSGSAAGESVAYYLIPYTFQPGDTVYNICLSMGVDFEKNSDLIKKLNSIKDYRSIADGKVLLIPSPKAPESGNYYKVVAHKLVSGETAESVAAGYGLDYSKVLNMMKLVNGKDSLEMIYAGTIFYVPVSCKA